MASGTQSDPAIFVGTCTFAWIGNPVSTKRQHPAFIIQHPGRRQSGAFSRARHASCAAPQALAYSRRGIRGHGGDRPGRPGIFYRLEERHRPISSGAGQSELAQLGSYLPEAAFGIWTRQHGRGRPGSHADRHRYVLDRIASVETVGEFFGTGKSICAARTKPRKSLRAAHSGFSECLGCQRPPSGSIERQAKSKKEEVHHASGDFHENCRPATVTLPETSLESPGSQAGSAACRL